MDSVLSNTIGLGRPPKVVRAEIVRGLKPEDLQGLAIDRGVRPPALKRLTEMHHLIARLIAEGEAGHAIALATGYSQSRISILKSDPAFQELVAQYAADVDDVRREYFVDTTAKLVAIRNDGLERIHENILDGVLDPRDTLDAVKMALDRSGYGPASKSQTTNLNVNYADVMANSRARGERLAAAVSEARAEKPALLPSLGETIDEEAD
jgi:hypothetical protein